MVLPSNAHSVVNRWFNIDNGGELSPVAWIAFLDFLRSNTKLKELSLFDSGLSEEQVIELMDVLKDNTALVSIDLSGKTNRFVASSRTIIDIIINEDELTPETAPQIIDIMQSNTSLISAIPHHGFIAKSEFVDRNYKVFREKREGSRFHYPTETLPPDPILLPDLTHEPAIKDLSLDILRLIVWQLSIKALCTFRRVDKQYYAFTKSSSFWRGYYTKHFSCIPGDVLLLTDLTYGLKLATSNSVTEAFAASIWEEITINSFRTRKAHPEYFPFAFGLPFMEQLYRQYPQLIGTIHSEHSFSVFPPEHTFFKTKESPYAYTWFLLYAKGSAVYHLGFEKLHDGQYNGILFFTPDFSAGWDRRFDYMLYIFEWFSAKNEAEFLEKSKLLCEVFLSARHTDHHDFVHSPFHKKVTELLEGAIKAREHCIEFLNEKIDAAAKEYCFTRNLDQRHSAAFVTMVEDLTKQFKEFTDVPDLEFERIRQRIPLRSVFNKKYVLDDNLNYHNFNSHDWGVPTPPEDAKQRMSKHRKSSKSIPLVAIMKLYRVALNFLLMPVLKTFWPGDIDHPDYELYPFLRWQKEALPAFRKLYYSGAYTPFSHVSVSSAPPSHWPLIALGLARQLLPIVIPVLNDVLDGFFATREDSNTNVDTLIGVLDQISAIPTSTKSFLRKIVAQKK
jgi:hypothetical protein